MFIELGQRTLASNRALHWRRLYLIVPVCVALGYVVGLYLAAWLLSQDTAGIWSNHPRQVLGYLLMSLVAGGVMTYYFMSREQLAIAREQMAHTQAQTEAAQRHAAESRLLLLQSQLEPHMLFNTLANLRALIGADPVLAQDVLDRLVSYLRATLSASRAPSHTLQAEFERLRDYLELMAARMGPRLQYALDLPEALADCPMPPLLLQPLVENAIRHGLEPKVEGGHITVRARGAAGQLVLEVSDTGIGLGPEGISREGFGLTQVRERLAAAYGDRGTMKLIATNQEGTRDSVSIPCEMGV